MTCYIPALSLNLIIMLISYNLYGYGRKWWMPEWYLAYSGRMKVYIYMYIYIYIRNGVSDYGITEYGIEYGYYWIGGLWASKAGSRCMETTIRSVISSPSTSGNNPRLAYIWMYVCWGAHLDTYLDIWVRREIIIIVIINVYHDPYYDSCYDSSYDFRYDSIMTPIMIPVIDLCPSCYVLSLWLLYDSQLWFYTLGFLWHETKVYIWGFPCLDYSFDVLISCDRDLSVYNHFCI